MSALHIAHTQKPSSISWSGAAGKLVKRYHKARDFYQKNKIVSRRLARDEVSI